MSRSGARALPSSLRSPLVLKAIPTKASSHLALTPSPSVVVVVPVAQPHQCPSVVSAFPPVLAAPVAQEPILEPSMLTRVERLPRMASCLPASLLRALEAAVDQAVIPSVSRRGLELFRHPSVAVAMPVVAETPSMSITAAPSRHLDNFHQASASAASAVVVVPGVALSAHRHLQRFR